MSDTLPEVLARNVDLADPAELVAEDARMRAVETVASERRDVLKRAVEQLAAGRAGWERDAGELGKCYMTSPTRRAKITDREEWTAWALREHPDDTATVERVNADVLEDALAGRLELPDGLADRLADVLDEIPNATRTDVVVGDKLAESVRKRCRETEDGRLADRDTGEIVPGLVAEDASTPSPRITPDKATVEALTDEIRQAVGVLELEEAG